MAEKATGQSEQHIERDQFNVAGDLNVEQIGDRITTEGGDYVARDKIINNYIESKTIVPEEALLKIEELPPKPGEPPYKGLAHFTEGDQDYYFGREKLSDRLVAQLKKRRFLALIGASGSGKSSLLHAGIIPRLRTDNWPIYVITPGAHPLAALANSLTRDDLDPDIGDKIATHLATRADTLLKTGDKLAARENAKRLLLAVDQFEALFTQCKDPGERKAFIDNLVTVAGAEGMTTVLIGMRADFYNRISDYAELTDLVSQQQEYVKPMAEEDLLQVVAEPAKRGGWQFVEGLVETILDDIGQEPGQLPLLSHALLETWDRRRDTIMTLSAYQEVGGVAGAIATTAENTLQLLGKEKEPIVKHVFLALTELGEGSEDTRRIASSQELMSLNMDEDAITEVVDALAEARLITLDKGKVEVAHEALIRRWPRLHTWIDEDRERLSFFRRLERAAKEWQKNAGKKGFLFHGSQLDQAESRIKEYSSWELTDLQAGFMSASRDWARESKDVGRQDALRSTVFALIGGALGLGISALLINLTAVLPGFFSFIYIALALGVGALAGLIYVTIFDRMVAAVKDGGVWQSWLVSILAGVVAFAISLGWLMAFVPVGWPLKLLIGAAWGAAAGGGRLWIQRYDMDIRFTVPLVTLLSGIVLAGAYLVAQGRQWFDSWAQPLPAWLFFVIGGLVPLTVLAAEYAAQTISRRSEQ